MPELWLLDNDLILKTCCFQIHGEAIAIFSREGRQLGVLGAARFVLAKRLQKLSAPQPAKDAASSALTIVWGATVPIEPTDDEVQLAASFETTAQELGASLDSGESLLLAILIKRPAELLLTGDKRAIAAIEGISARLALAAQTSGRVACFEQLLIAVATRHGHQLLRGRVCAMAAADRTASICCACSSAAVDDKSIEEGLASYAGSVRASAPTVLMTAAL